MDTILIHGGNALRGEICVQGSKNAALPLLAASVLVPGVSVLHNCPDIADAALMMKLLESVGCKVVKKEHTVFIDATVLTGTAMRYEYTQKMRSSVIFMGAMLGRMGEVELGYPGGCVIGERPINLHLEAIRAFGGVAEEKDGFLTAKAAKLRGGAVRFLFPSVGATENAVLTAVLAEGRTVIENAAPEPEIDALCGFLTEAGAKISRKGSTLFIDGVKRLTPCEYTVPSDRIVAGTYLLGCMSAGGEIFLKGCPAGELGALFEALRAMGARLWLDKSGVGIHQSGRPEALAYLKTEVYPGFPTDLQSPLLSVLALADGDSAVEETIFENRFRVLEPLTQMGARIEQRGKKVFLHGVERLCGAQVTALELRGGAGLVVAALAAEGRSVIRQSGFIDRGYENIVTDLERLGADIAYGKKNHEKPIGSDSP